MGSAGDAVVNVTSKALGRAYIRKPEACTLPSRSD